MSRHLYRAILLALLVAVPARAGQELVVLVPSDFTFTTDNTVKVFAYRPGGKEPLPVSVNGIAKPPIEGETFPKGEVTLAMGINDVKIGDKTVRVFYLPGSSMKEFRFPAGEGGPRVFRKYQLHPALDEGCEACHTVEGGKLSAKDQKEACYACHTNFEKADEGTKVYLHAPVANGECTSCHDPHLSVRPKLQKNEKGCLECHDAPPQEGVVHYPVKNGECTSCHGPHSGPAPRQLVRQGNALCLGCHESPHVQHRSAKVTGKNTVIPPDVPIDNSGEIGCLACHFHHQSAERRLFRKSQGVLCQTCHQM